MQDDGEGALLTAAVVEAEPAEKGSALLLAMLFLVGCGLGGALIATLGLFEVPL